MHSMGWSVPETNQMTESGNVSTLSSATSYDYPRRGNMYKMDRGSIKPMKMSSKKGGSKIEDWGDHGGGGSDSVSTVYLPEDIVRHGVSPGRCSERRWSGVLGEKVNIHAGILERCTVPACSECRWKAALLSFWRHQDVPLTFKGFWLRFRWVFFAWDERQHRRWIVRGRYGSWTGNDDVR